MGHRQCRARRPGQVDLVAQRIEEIATRERASQRVVTGFRREQLVRGSQLPRHEARGAVQPAFAQIRHHDHDAQQDRPEHGQEDEDPVAPMIAHDLRPAWQRVDDVCRES